MSIVEAAARIRDNGIWGFWKVGRIDAGPDDEVPYPSRCDRFDYEGEVASYSAGRARMFGPTTPGILSGA